MAKLSDGKTGGNTYLKAEDIKQGQEVTLTIDRIEQEQISRDDGSEQQKLVCYFRGKEKGLVLNNTNIDVLIDTYGDDTDALAGKTIVLYRTTAQFKGQTVPALRLRAPIPPTPHPEGVPSLWTGTGTLHRAERRELPALRPVVQERDRRGC